MQPGSVRDRLVHFLTDWLDRLESTIRDAQAEGAIDPAEDPGQLAFEVEAALFLANAQYVVTRTRGTHRPRAPSHRSTADHGEHPGARGGRQARRQAPWVGTVRCGRCVLLIPPDPAAIIAAGRVAVIATARGRDVL
jgi:hypothetical protein